MTSPLRIAYLTPEFVTEEKFDGGLANYLDRLVKYLAREGHHPEVFVLGECDETVDHDGIPVHRVRRAPATTLRLFRKILKRTTGIQLKATEPLIAGAQVLAERFSRQHDQQPFDLVQGSDYGATGLYLPRKRSFPFITRLSYHRPLWREMAGLETSVDRRWAERLEARSIQRSDGCYGPSRRIARVVEQELGMRVDVLRPPVSVEQNGLVEDESVLNSQIADRRYVLFFGRICRIKGADLVAEATRPLLEEDPSLHLVMVGREDPEGVLERIRTTLGNTADRLITPGRLPHPRLFPMIRRAQAVLLPSRIDNFPNVCIEAMRLGRVVVGTREASFDELIDDGRNGFLASCDAVPSITAALRRALKLSEEERRLMGEAARSKIGEFTPDLTVPPLCEFYRRAIARRCTST